VLCYPKAIQGPKKTLGKRQLKRSIAIATDRFYGSDKKWIFPKSYSPKQKCKVFSFQTALVSLLQLSVYARSKVVPVPWPRGQGAAALMKSG